MIRQFSSRKTWILPIFTLIMIVVFWEILCQIFQPPVYIIPSPIDIALKSIELSNRILEDVLVTATESLFGFILGSSLGVLFGS